MYFLKNTYSITEGGKIVMHILSSQRMMERFYFKFWMNTMVTHNNSGLHVINHFMFEESNVIEWKGCKICIITRLCHEFQAEYPANIWSHFKFWSMAEPESHLSCCHSLLYVMKRLQEHTWNINFLVFSKCVYLSKYIWWISGHSHVWYNRQQI